MRTRLSGPVAGALGGAAIGAALTLHADLAPLLGDFLGEIPAIALWCGFSLYWTAVARNAAPAAKSEAAASTVWHQSVLGVAMLLLVLPGVPGLRMRYLPDTWLLVALGGAVQLGFLQLAVWARRHLGRNWSAEVRVALDHELVCSGPYRVLRHPIYTAMLGMFLGTAIATGEVHSVLALAILVLAYRRKTRLEEEILRETFGAQYDDYRRDTWALVPGLY